LPNVQQNETKGIAIELLIVIPINIGL